MVRTAWHHGGDDALMEMTRWMAGNRGSGHRSMVFGLLWLALIATVACVVLWNHGGSQGNSKSPTPHGAPVPPAPVTTAELPARRGELSLAVETRPFTSAPPTVFRAEFRIEGEAAGKPADRWWPLPPTAEVRVYPDGETSIAVSRQKEFGEFVSPTRPRELRFECDGFESTVVRVPDSTSSPCDLGMIVFRGSVAVAVTVAAPVWPRPQEIVIAVVDQVVDISRMAAKGTLSLTEGHGQLQLRARASEELAVRLHFADPGIALRSSQMALTRGRPGETARVHFDLTTLPWTEFRLRGVPDRHDSRIDARIQRATDSRGALGLASPLHLSFSVDRTARGVFPEPGFLQGGLILPDGEAKLHEVRGKQAKWKVPLPPILEVEPESPLATVKLLTSAGEGFRGSLGFGETSTLTPVTANESILLKAATLRDERTKIRLGADYAISVADCAVVWEAEDCAVLRIPELGTPSRLQLHWTIAQPRATHAKLFPIDGGDATSGSPWRRPGFEAQSVSSGGAAFRSVGPGRYEVWVESRLGTALLRLPALEPIDIPDNPGAPIVVRVEKVREATFVVRNWRVLAAASRPDAVSVESGSLGTLLGADGEAAVLIPDRPTITVRLGPRSLLGGVLATATVEETTDGSLRVLADCPAQALRRLEVSVPLVFSGDLLAVAASVHGLPEVVRPFPPPGDLIRGDQDRLSWRSAENEAHVMAVWELSPLANDARLTFRALAFPAQSGPEFACGPDGSEVGLTAPPDWSAFHAEIVETPPGATSPRNFVTHVASREGSMTVWVPSRCELVRIHATNEVGDAVHREFRPPFPATLVLN